MIGELEAFAGDENPWRTLLVGLLLATPVNPPALVEAHRWACTVAQGHSATVTEAERWRLVLDVLAVDGCDQPVMRLVGVTTDLVALDPRKHRSQGPHVKAKVLEALAAVLQDQAERCAGPHSPPDRFFEALFTRLEDPRLREAVQLRIRCRRRGEP